MEIITTATAVVAILISVFALWQTYAFRRKDIVIAALTELEIASNDIEQLDGEPDRLTEEWDAAMGARSKGSSGAQIARTTKHESFKQRAKALRAEIEELQRLLPSAGRKTISTAVVRTHSVKSKVISLRSDIDRDNRELEAHRQNYKEALAHNTGLRP